MLNRKSLIALCCVLSLLVVMAALSAPPLALSQMTIPSRTPVPGGGGPDPEPEPTDDNGGGGRPRPTDEPNPTGEPGPGPDPTDEAQPLPPSPVPTQAPATAVPTLAAASATPPNVLATATRMVLVGTNTPFPTAAVGTEVPIATATAATGEVIVAFPDDNQPFPQAGPCSMPPTFTTLNAISVYAGPGEDYELVGLIGEGEVRPIIGRAAFVNYWLVQLDRSGRSGWVDDAAGGVHGYTGRVSIVSAPDLYGVAPTPGGSAWVPTPEADCSAAEILTSVVTYSSDGEGSEVPPSGKPDSLEALPEIGGSEQTAQGEQADQGIETDPSQIQKVGESFVNPANPGQSKREAAADPILNDLADSAAPLQVPATPALQLPNLMPVAGLILILAAIFIGLYAKKSRSGAGD